MRSFLPIALLLLLCMATPVPGKPTPDAEKIPSFPVSKAAAAIIDPLDRRELMEDATFLTTLRTVLGDRRLSAVDRTDAFYLMLRKVGWEFTGTVRIFPQRNYAQTFSGTASTYLSYQDRLVDLRYDPAPLLAIAAADCAKNVVRCSHALLLSTIVNPKASAPKLKPLIAVGVLERAEVPPIFLHNLSLAVVLSRDFSLASQLGSLLSHVDAEEGQEDILCAVGMFNAPEMPAAVRSFLQEALKSKFDAAVETGIFVLHRQLEGLAFEQAYSDLLDAPSAPESRTRLVELQQSNFASLTGFRERSGWVKIWDGFSVTMYDDGMVLTHGAKFRDFKPR